MQAIDVQNLSKTYDNGIAALKEVSFRVAPGDFFALLGPNGAGKSTIIGILTSLVRKSSGRVHILGHDVDTEFTAAKSLVGVVPQEFNFNAFRRVEESLIAQAGYYGIPYREAKKRAEKYLHQLELWEKRRSNLHALSGGMKRRYMIARALMNTPKILFLDEPTAGVDIEIRRAMWTYLSALNASGVTVILTTHYLEEVEQLCNQMAIINHGKLVASGQVTGLLKDLDAERFILYLQAPCQSAPRLSGYDIQQVDSETLEVEVSQQHNLTDLLAALSDQGIVVNSLRNKTNRLEALFLRLTQSSGEMT